MNYKASLFILLLITAVLTSSCEELPPCKTYYKRLLIKETYLVVTDKGLPGRSFFVAGYNPVSKKEVTYSDGDGIYLDLFNQLDISDTLIKNKGSMSFLIMKEKINIIVSPTCTDDYSKKRTGLESAYGRIKCDTLQKNAVKQFSTIPYL